MGSYHPNGSLYEKPLDLAAAQAQHARFRYAFSLPLGPIFTHPKRRPSPKNHFSCFLRLDIMLFRAELEKAGCQVMTVREILAKDCDVDVVARVKLEDLAASCLTYKLIGDPSQLTNKETYLMSDEYKREVVEKMDTQQLVEIVLTRPTIYLEKADKDTELSAQNYTLYVYSTCLYTIFTLRLDFTALETSTAANITTLFSEQTPEDTPGANTRIILFILPSQPLSNLVFCRDQQITTAKGVVMARPRAAVRCVQIIFYHLYLQQNLNGCATMQSARGFHHEVLFPEASRSHCR